MNQALLILFTISLFTSKSAVDIFFVLCFLTALYLYARECLSAKKILITKPLHTNLNFAIFVIWSVGGLLQFFSLGGARASANFLVDMRMMFFPFILTMLLKNPAQNSTSLPSNLPLNSPSSLTQKRINQLINIALGMFVISVLFSFVKLGSVYAFDLNRVNRLDSFWDIARWGVLLMCCLIYSLVYLNENYQKIPRTKLIMWIILIAIALLVFLLNRSRAVWMGLIFAMLLYLFYRPKAFLTIVLPIIISSSLVILPFPSLRDRLSSILDVQLDKKEFSSKDQSNAGRLLMWTMGIRFFKEQPLLGTGFDTLETPYRQWTDRLPEADKLQMQGKEFSHNDLHNAYLHALVSFGAILSALFFGLIFAWVLKLAFIAKQAGSHWAVRASVLSALAFLITSVFYGELFSYPGYWLWGSIWIGHWQHSAS